MLLKLKKQTMFHIVYVVKVQGIHTNFLILGGAKGPGLLEEIFKIASTL